MRSCTWATDTLGAVVTMESRPLPLHAREEEGARVRHADAALPAHRFSRLLAGGSLGAVPLVERADGHEAAAQGDGACPHAEPIATELVERGLDAGVEDGARPVLQREAPGKLDRGEGSMGVQDVGGDLGAGIGVVDGVELVAARDAGAPVFSRASRAAAASSYVRGIMRVHMGYAP